MRNYIGFVIGRRAYVRIAAESKEEAERIFLREYGFNDAGNVYPEKDFNRQKEYYDRNGYTCEASLNEEARLKRLRRLGVV